ncbi:MAG: NUDIX domain-containing protein [bacterium]
MLNEIKKSVGIQLIGRKKNGQIIAILQVRAKWNSEKNSPESFPGACQVSVHGGLEEGEDFIQALLREVGEELGKDIIPAIKKLSDNNQLVELINLEKSNKHVITYGALIEQEIYQKLLEKTKSNSFGGFRIIKSDEVDKIVDIKTFDKTIGITDEKVIAMFPDEKEALKIAFVKLG